MHDEGYKGSENNTTAIAVTWENKMCLSLFKAGPSIAESHRIPGNQDHERIV